MSGMLLQARGLTKVYPPAGRGPEHHPVRAVDDVDIDIDEGQTHGLVGESGSGKTTVGRLLLRLTEADAGTAMFKGVDLLALEGADLRRVRSDIQLVFQDPFSSVDPRYRAWEIVAEPWLTHRMFDRAERRRRAVALLARVGIDPTFADRRPASFSGGQLQRIGIARALALEPSLVICDEPVSALDVSVQAQIVNLLIELQAERRVSYLFIAHDLALVRHLSHRVSVMYLGRIVETGTREDVFGRAAHPYTQALLAAMGRPDPGALAGRIVRGEGARPGEIPSGCAYRTRCPKAQAACATERPALIDRGQGHPVACHFADVDPTLAVLLAGPAQVARADGSAPDARVDRDDGHVGDEVHEGHEQAGHDADPDDQGGIHAA
jgi:oligopeptide/dipeptide ABC transporter ATP-binding protein